MTVREWPTIAKQFVIPARPAWAIQCPKAQAVVLALVPNITYSVIPAEAGIHDKVAPRLIPHGGIHSTICWLDAAPLTNRSMNIRETTIAERKA